MSPHQSTERADLLDAAREHRTLFLIPVTGVTDEQARSAPTVSELTLGGLVKHLTATEAEWMRFIVDGPGEEEPVDWDNVDWSNPPAAVLERIAEFTMGPEETLESLIAAYVAGGVAADELVATCDLDAGWELPPAPWYTPGTVWSARRVWVHMLAETAQHAGHADIIREAIDGQKSMG